MGGLACMSMRFFALCWVLYAIRVIFQPNVAFGDISYFQVRQRMSEVLQQIFRNNIKKCVKLTKKIIAFKLCESAQFIDIVKLNLIQLSEKCQECKRVIS
jgi:hypothetical protein